MSTPKPQTGTWTLSAPDGRKWVGENPLSVVRAEINERVPPAEQLRRVIEAAQPTPDEIEIEHLHALAKDAYEAWGNDMDSKVGKLLRAMLDKNFRHNYRPDLTYNEEAERPTRAATKGDHDH